MGRHTQRQGTWPEEEAAILSGRGGVENSSLKSQNSGVQGGPQHRPLTAALEQLPEFSGLGPCKAARP